jgi:hypothetical protein
MQQWLAPEAILHQACALVQEKFRTWSDCKGDVESRFTKDELLTNVSVALNVTPANLH